MTYKSVLVDLSKQSRAEAMLDVAEPIAQMCGSRLIGTFILPRMQIHSDSPREVSLAVTHRQAWEGRRDQIRAAFEQRLPRIASGGEWREVDVSPEERAGALIAQCRTVDLVIASQTDPAWGDTAEFDAPQHLVLASGRPVLVVPNSGSFPSIGQRVLVAWNDTREAARAVFDAIPLMARADEVKVTWFSPHRTSTVDDKASTKELTRTLWQHRINAVAAQTFATDMGVADEILNQVEKMDADLLVMGCYGHSRTRELLLGGATREILKSMTVPVLMSH